MSNSDISRFSRRVVQYFWDPMPKNEDESAIWCLGRAYDSRYRPLSQQKHGSPSGLSESGASQADSGIETLVPCKEETAENGSTALSTGQPAAGDDDEEAMGWPSDFLDDLEARIWLTYRNNFVPIPRSDSVTATAGISFSTKLRNLTNMGGFTSDTGWGCMIRSGQSLLANTLARLRLGTEWRLGESTRQHLELLSLFADNPESPFSIHRFVEHGASACGKHPGEWFGPSATARCIQALTDRYHEGGLRVYARPDDGDVYANSVIATAGAKDADDTFRPTLIVLGVRLGIDRITPVYHAALKAALEMPQSVGIAGGRPSSSHYFIGHQGDQFFYLDPHTTRPALPAQPSAEDLATCHTRRVRTVKLVEMDPSMLIGFLINSKEEFDEWRKAVSETAGKAIIHIHDKEPAYATGSERPEAVDEVETWDEHTDADEE